MYGVNEISKNYCRVEALANVSVDFPDGRTTVLVGPSGCGKSTLLRILIGLITADSGTVTIDNQTLTTTNCEHLRHEIGYVIQDGGLFPHLTAKQNITLLARFLATPQSKIEQRLQELAELTQMPLGSLSRYPSELSGGQRQRVSLMRALMLDPKLLLLDEPLGALDPLIRYELQEQLKEIFERLGKTVVFVTHDMGEAAYFETGGIVLMQSGHVVQRGSLKDLLENPAAPFVSQFLQAQRAPVLQVAEVKPE